MLYLLRLYVCHTKFTEVRCLCVCVLVFFPFPLSMSVDSIQIRAPKRECNIKRILCMYSEAIAAQFQYEKQKMKPTTQNTHTHKMANSIGKFNVKACNLHDFPMVQKYCSKRHAQCIAHTFRSFILFNTDESERATAREREREKATKKTTTYTFSNSSTCLVVHETSSVLYIGGDPHVHFACVSVRVRVSVCSV